jgi:hypothetical protein
MTICTECSTEIDGEIVSPEGSLVDRQCYLCGTILTQERVDELVAQAIADGLLPAAD